VQVVWALIGVALRADRHIALRLGAASVATDNLCPREGDGGASDRCRAWH